MVSYGEIDHQQFGCKPWVTLCVMGVKPTTHFDEELQKKNVPKRTKGRGNSYSWCCKRPEGIFTASLPSLQVDPSGVCWKQDGLEPPNSRRCRSNLTLLGQKLIQFHSGSRPCLGGIIWNTNDFGDVRTSPFQATENSANIWVCPNIHWLINQHVPF